MTSASRDGARFQPLPSGPSGPGSSSSRSSFDSTSDPNDADDEAFALLSDDDAVSLLSDDIELEEISTAGPSAGSGSRRAKSRSEMDQRFQDAIHAERNMTPRDAIRAYPMAVFWSLVVSLCVIMEGQFNIRGNYVSTPS